MADEASRVLAPAWLDSSVGFPSAVLAWWLAVLLASSCLVLVSWWSSDWSHRPYEPPVPHGDTPAFVDLDHHLTVGLVLEDNARLVPLGWVRFSLVLDGYRCPDLKIIKVIGPVAPPLVVHLSLVGEGPFPVLLADGPVLGGLLLVCQAGDEIPHLVPKHHLCWGRSPGWTSACRQEQC
jgi:hypothetical protein